MDVFSAFTGSGGGKASGVHMSRGASMMPLATSLRSLPLPPSTLRRLDEAGFLAVGDLRGLTPHELAEELGVEEPQAAHLLLLARTGGVGADAVGGDASTRSSSSGAGPSGGARRSSALELLHRERSSRRIPTLAHELDELLAGGVPLRQLTELAGAPGVGKTQLAIQLALNVQIPHAFGGVEGSAVYIDAEGSFLATRALQMAEALVRRLRASASNEAQREAALRLDPGAMLDRIYVYRVHEAVELLAAIRAAGELHGASPPVRLLVVDSVAFHLRHAEMTYARRLQVVGGMSQSLVSLAQGRGLAAVAVNQVTTKVNDALGTSSLVPALGESWAHVCNLQLLVSWRDGERLASLYKGLPPGEATFAVGPDGVRSRSEEDPAARHHHHHHHPAASAMAAAQQQQQQQQHELPQPYQPYRPHHASTLGAAPSAASRSALATAHGNTAPYGTCLPNGNHGSQASVQTPHHVLGDAACSSCAPLPTASGKRTAEVAFSFDP